VDIADFGSHSDAASRMVRGWSGTLIAGWSRTIITVSKVAVALNTDNSKVWRASCASFRLLSPLAVRLLQVRALARQDPERPANALIEPVMLAVLAQHGGLSPLTMTLGTDLGRRWPGWVATWLVVAMVLPAGVPSGKAGSLCSSA
jgi:hypothetical protein